MSKPKDYCESKYKVKVIKSFVGLRVGDEFLVSLWEIDALYNYYLKKSRGEIYLPTTISSINYESIYWDYLEIEYTEERAEYFV